MTPPLRVRYCEFCGGRLQHRAESTICDACDKQLEMEWNQEMEQMKSLHTRRCQQCAGPLPLARYFHCLTCRPVDVNQEVWVEVREQGPKRRSPGRRGAI